jgi:hypothetical protein
MNAFAWIRSFTIVFCDFLAEFTTLKGANSNPMSKPLLGAKLLQAQSAKMAQKLTSSNHQNNTREKYNFLSTNMLNGLIQNNPPTGTSFAYLRPEKMQLLRKEYKNV